jgi:hypothetical protein
MGWFTGLDIKIVRNLNNSLVTNSSYSSISISCLRKNTSFHVGFVEKFRNKKKLKTSLLKFVSILNFNLELKLRFSYLDIESHSKWNFAIAYEVDKKFQFSRTHFFKMKFPPIQKMFYKKIKLNIVILIVLLFIQISLQGNIIFYKSIMFTNNR